MKDTEENTEPGRQSLPQLRLWSNNGGGIISAHILYTFALDVFPYQAHPTQKTDTFSKELSNPQ